MAGKEIGRNSLTRRDALKSFGAALGSTLMAQPAWAGSIQPEGAQTKQSTVSQVMPGQRHKMPNILYINCEGVPLGVLSCYGSMQVFLP